MPIGLTAYICTVEGEWNTWGEHPSFTHRVGTALPPPALEVRRDNTARCAVFLVSARYF